MEIRYTESFFEDDAIKRVLLAFFVLLMIFAALAGVSSYIDVPLGYRIAVLIISLLGTGLSFYATFKWYSMDAGILLDDDTLTLPSYYRTRPDFSIPLDTITAKKLTKKKKKKLLKIRHLHGVVVIKNSQLEEPDKIDDLHERIETNEELLIKLPQPWATYAIAIVLAVIGLLHIFFDTATPLITLLERGAWEQSLVLAGELDRVLTYAFLHQHLTHLLSNVIALLIIGFAIEHRIKWHQLVSIFLIGTVVGSLGAFLSGHPTVIGASGGIYALVGSYVYLRIKKPDPVSERIKVPTLIVISIALIFEAITAYYFTNIAFGVHVFGFIAGVACGFLLVAEIHPQAVTYLMAPVVILLLLSAFRFWQQSEEQNLLIAERWLTDPEDEFRMQSGAWIIATSPESSRLQIGRAVTQLTSTKLDARGTDILATLYARSGRLKQAIELENKIIANDERIGSQIARFELAYTINNPINIEAFSSVQFIQVDAICNDNVFARVITYETNKIPEICRRQETVYIQAAEKGAKNLRYLLDPKVMALPL